MLGESRGHIVQIVARGYVEMLFYKSVAAQNIYVVAVRAVFTARLIESNIAAVRRYIFYRYPRVFKNGLSAVT